MKIWCDCVGWNGKECGYLVLFEEPRYVDDIHRNREIWSLSSSPRTNNELEYLGLIKALDMAENGDVIYSDSMLIVEQVVGRFACRAHNLTQLCDEARMIYHSKNLRIEWVPRERNLAGLRVSKVQGEKRYLSRRKKNAESNKKKHRKEATRKSSKAESHKQIQAQEVSNPEWDSADTNCNDSVYFRRNSLRCEGINNAKKEDRDRG